MIAPGNHNNLNSLRGAPPFAILRRIAMTAVNIMKQLSSAGRDGFLGKGGFGARERDSQRLPYADFFGYFLVRKQESNILLHC